MNSDSDPEQFLQKLLDRREVAGVSLRVEGSGGRGFAGLLIRWRIVRNEREGTYVLLAAALVMVILSAVVLMHGSSTPSLTPEQQSAREREMSMPPGASPIVPNQ